MSINPLILIGAIAAALLALILLARGRGPRRIGMGGGRSGGGAVSRARRKPDRAPPPDDHPRHGPDWRTSSVATAKPRSDGPAKSRPEAASLHDRLAQMRARAERDGKPPSPEEALKVFVGSKEATGAVPGVFRLAKLAVWAWMGLWGFSAVMILVSVLTGEAEEEAIFGLAFVIFPIAIGFAGLRAIKRFRARIEQRLAQGGR